MAREKNIYIKELRIGIAIRADCENKSNVWRLYKTQMYIYISFQLKFTYIHTHMSIQCISTSYSDNKPTKYELNFSWKFLLFIEKLVVI